MILATFAQADGRSKNRPGLVLRVLPGYGDLLVCGISTQMRQKVVGFDEIITTKDKDFATSGLLRDSLIRLGFLSLVPRSRVIGTIGSIATERHHRLLRRFSAYLLSAIP